ncbi:MAG: ATP-binding cassette domain-containing protein [Terrimesophilobacter sp.]
MSTRTTIECEGLSKNFGPVRAVHDLSFSVKPGLVTGFLGPNGAGKTTTLRMLLGLVRPTRGTASFGGVAYKDLPHPLATVGTALEASSFHPGRSARDHLWVYAIAARIDRTRIDIVLEQVGLTESAERKVGGYSLGMRQRLGLAFALMGNPGVLVLDEPVNGLDPEGIKWIRSLLRELASEGRTVLISSHLLSEVQQSVDQIIIISHGELVYDGGLSGLDVAQRTIVDAPNRLALTAALTAAGANIASLSSGLAIAGMTSVQVGEIALKAGVALSHLATEHEGLEKAFLDLVGEGGKP